MKRRAANTPGMLHQHGRSAGPGGRTVKESDPFPPPPSQQQAPHECSKLDREEETVRRGCPRECPLSTAEKNIGCIIFQIVTNEIPATTILSSSLALSTGHHLPSTQITVYLLPVLIVNWLSDFAQGHCKLQSEETSPEVQ